MLLYCKGGNSFAASRTFAHIVLLVPVLPWKSGEPGMNSGCFGCRGTFGGGWWPPEPPCGQPRVPWHGAVCQCWEAPLSRWGAALLLGVISWAILPPVLGKDEFFQAKVLPVAGRMAIAALDPLLVLPSVLSCPAFTRPPSFLPKLTEPRDLS